MYILCDTCSILLVIRITPTMFIDPRFECATLPSVRDEIFSTQKFRHRYPWRDDFKSQIVSLATTAIAAANHEYYLKLVRNLVTAGVTNAETGRYFNLSRVDQSIAAFVIAAGCDISTGDAALAEFLKQEFETANVSALGLVNRWLETGLVTVNANLLAVIKEWRSEHPQPPNDIAAFERITGLRYPARHSQRKNIR